MDAGVVDARQVREHGLGAGVDEDRVRADAQTLGPAGDRDAALADEAGLALDDRDRLAVREQGVVDGAELLDEGVAPGDGGREALPIPCRAVLLAVVDERLGGDAADVDAGAAVHLAAPLDHGDPSAGAGERPGEGLASLAPADHHHVHVQVLPVAHRCS